MIDKQLPEASEGKEPLNQPTDPDARAAWPWWKLKKWALRVASLFIQRCVSSVVFHSDLCGRRAHVLPSSLPGTSSSLAPI